MKWVKCEDPEHCSDDGIWHVGEDDCPTGGPHSVSPAVDCLCGATWAELYEPAPGDVVAFYGYGRTTVVGMGDGIITSAWGNFLNCCRPKGAVSMLYERSQPASTKRASGKPPHWPQEPLQRDPAPEPGAQLGLSCCRTHLAGYRCSCSSPARLDNPKPDPYRGGLRDAPPRIERKN